MRFISRTLRGRMGLAQAGAESLPRGISFKIDQHRLTNIFQLVIAILGRAASVQEGQRHVVCVEQHMATAQQVIPFAQGVANGKRFKFSGTVVFLSTICGARGELNWMKIRARFISRTLRGRIGLAQASAESLLRGISFDVERLVEVWECQANGVGKLLNKLVEFAVTFGGPAEFRH